MSQSLQTAGYFLVCTETYNGKLKNTAHRWNQLINDLWKEKETKKQIKLPVT